MTPAHLELLIAILLSLWGCWVTYELINLHRVTSAIIGILRGLVRIVKELSE